jgi:hypothetical protein
VLDQLKLIPRWVPERCQGTAPELPLWLAGELNALARQLSVLGLDIGNRERQSGEATDKDPLLFWSVVWHCFYDELAIARAEH